MMRFFARLRNQRVTRLLGPSSKTERKDQPVLKLFNTNIAENAAGGLVATGVLALISYFTGAGSKEDEIKRLKDELLIAKQKQSSTEQKLERNEQKLGRAEANNEELAMILQKNNQEFMLSLRQQQAQNSELNLCLQSQQACQSAFQKSYCFFRQPFAQPKQKRIITDENNHTPGGPSC